LAVHLQKLRQTKPHIIALSGSPISLFGFRKYPTEALPNQLSFPTLGIPLTKTPSDKPGLKWQLNLPLKKYPTGALPVTLSHSLLGSLFVKTLSDGTQEFAVRIGKRVLGALLESEVVEVSLHGWMALEREQMKIKCYGFQATIYL
jgi:hypothetical protein